MKEYLYLTLGTVMTVLSLAVILFVALPLVIGAIVWDKLRGVK